MSVLHREISEVRYQLGMYGWTVKEYEDCLEIDMRGDVFYVPYFYIDDVGANSVIRYCKARFIISKK